jgi:hypothetical protein
MMNFVNSSLNPAVMSALTAHRDCQAQREQVIAKQTRAPVRSTNLSLSEMAGINTASDDEDEVLLAPIRLESYAVNDDDRVFVASDDSDGDYSDAETSETEMDINVQNIIPVGITRTRRQSTFMYMVPTPEDIRELVECSSSDEDNITNVEDNDVLVLDKGCVRRQLRGPDGELTMVILPEDMMDIDDTGDFSGEEDLAGYESGDSVCSLAGVMPASAWRNTTLLAEDLRENDLEDLDEDYKPGSPSASDFEGDSTSSADEENMDD